MNLNPWSRVIASEFLVVYTCDSYQSVVDDMAVGLRTKDQFPTGGSVLQHGAPVDIAFDIATVGSSRWPEPRVREVALFTDLSLHSEALQLAADQGTVSAVSLQQQLRQRLHKMRLVLSHGQRTMERLIREQRLFGWLMPVGNSSANLNQTAHALTTEGVDALQLSRTNPRLFRRLLAIKMQEVYVVPGWFVTRLWHINASGQGEVILPGPSPDWKPTRRRWDEADWPQEMEEQALRAASQARAANIAAFPIQDADWVNGVHVAWNRLGRKVSRNSDDKTMSYSPRDRLTKAMREAAIGLLFGNIPYGSRNPDFPGERPPINPRTFMGWCPRLEALELVFYTDWHPWISGRLMFPVSVFRPIAPADRFEQIPEILDPDGASLWLHQSGWPVLRSLFLATLISVHQRIALATDTIYVSLPDVRDEVCRQLRISAILFDDYLKLAIDELPAKDFPWSIAIESDIREEQTSGPGQNRRPVYLDMIPHGLIGLAPLAEK